MVTKLEQQAVDQLRTPSTIRQRCDRLFQLACQDQLPSFRVDLAQLDKTAHYVLEVIYQEYPDLNIPFHSRWRHFEVGNRDRLNSFDRALAELSPLEKAKAKFDLAIVSVLLDAGAGATWQYCEPETGHIYSRSEGLAVASFQMFCQGIFSSDPKFPWQVDATGLLQLQLSTLATAFQVSETNSLVGLEGRLQLLQRLGKTLNNLPRFFGEIIPRPGELVNYLLNAKVSAEQTIKAAEVLRAVLQGFGDIWPGRYEIGGVNLGDVWPHSALQGDNPGARFVPFHKLSQWLTYSLLEPLQEIGLEVQGLDELTGLPEYRNGGLCLDLGLIQAKDPAIFQQFHLPSSEAIVEWRALTVILLDRIGTVIRQTLNRTESELPLVKILQGGTWTAGRKIAKELRVQGVPPIQIESDGTVF